MDNKANSNSDLREKMFLEMKEKKYLTRLRIMLSIM